MAGGKITISKTTTGHYCVRRGFYNLACYAILKTDFVKNNITYLQYSSSSIVSTTYSSGITKSVVNASFILNALGTTEVYFGTQASPKLYTFTVEVTDPVEIPNVAKEPYDYELGQGSNKDTGWYWTYALSYVSSDPEVATMKSNGYSIKMTSYGSYKGYTYTIEAHNPGTVTLYGYNDGELKDTITIKVRDTEAPVIHGLKNTTIEYGSDFDVFEGITVTDNSDAQDQITLEANPTSVDTTVSGLTIITYTATDTSGNVATRTRDITVKVKEPVPTPTPTPTLSEDPEESGVPESTPTPTPLAAPTEGNTGKTETSSPTSTPTTPAETDSGDSEPTEKTNNQSQKVGNVEDTTIEDDNLEESTEDNANEDSPKTLKEMVVIKLQEYFKNTLDLCKV